MKLSDYIGKTILIAATYHPLLGVKAYVATVNRRTRKLVVIDWKTRKQHSVFPHEVILMTIRTSQETRAFNSLVEQADQCTLYQCDRMPVSILIKVCRERGAHHLADCLAQSARAIGYAVNSEQNER